MAVKSIDNIRIGLDVDGVLANFSEAFIKKGRQMGIQCCLPKDWKVVDKWMFPCADHFKEVWDTAVEHSYNFWLGIPPLPKAVKYFKQKTAFTPELYITKRPCPSWVTRKWIRANEFPDAEVITVNDPADKLIIVKERCDAYVDDLPSTVRQMLDAGVNAYLYAAPFHTGENIDGLPLIHNLGELRGLLRGRR